MVYYFRSSSYNKFSFSQLSHVSTNSITRKAPCTISLAVQNDVNPQDLPGQSDSPTNPACTARDSNIINIISRKLSPKVTCLVKCTNSSLFTNHVTIPTTIP